MQVQIADIDATLPQDSYISVKVGDVHKQSLYDPKRLYCFPDVRRAGKVSIFSRVGTCDFIWAAEHPETKLCKAMHLNGDTGIRLQVSTQRLGCNAAEGVDPTIACSNSKAQEKSLKAREYLREHDVESFLASAMRALLKSMPDDPSAFLCNFISTHCVDGGTDFSSQDLDDLKKQVAAAESKLAESEGRLGELQRQVKDLEQNA